MERYLAELLASMAAYRKPGRYVFATCESVPAGLAVWASVREDEGLSVVLETADADAAGIAYDFVAAWLTLRVHSDLAAIGLTAAVSAALAAEGIACNVVAGRWHDHLLVPEDRADDALSVLRALSERARDGLLVRE